MPRNKQMSTGTDPVILDASNRLLILDFLNEGKDIINDMARKSTYLFGKLKVVQTNLDKYIEGSKEWAHLEDSFSSFYDELYKADSTINDIREFLVKD